ncbi:hypothetical protein [Streptomyces sp. NPDC058572]|uniref:hypothetical protein n=1 Tax=Streptomyces sp. NPDC058572 TaxID=3346546 RepID=UPI003665DCFD
MKYSRAAAVIAGSVVALGAASPAFAADTTRMPAMSLGGGLDRALASAPDPGLGDAESTVGSVASTATGLNNVKGKAPEQLLRTAASATPMLGGVSLGGAG